MPMVKQVITGPLASHDRGLGIRATAVGRDEKKTPGGVVTAVEAEAELRGAQAPPGDDDVRAALDRLAAQLGLTVAQRRDGRMRLATTDGSPAATWREGHPYADRLRRADYESAKRTLQIELLKLQRSVKMAGGRLAIVFEGRDAAGKGGAIRRFTENLNPRGTRIVAMEKPGPHEQGDHYLRRYLPHLPGPGEIVLFDRSWYNRAGVEHVMGFCRPDEYARFLRDVPDFESELVADGVTLVKLWFSVTRAEQLRRFIERYADPVKRWKLSPVDVASLDRWHEYTAAKEIMFSRTNQAQAPWIVVRGNDKRRARIEAMRYVLSICQYEGKNAEVVGRPDPLIAGPARTMADPVPSPAGLAGERDPVTGTDAGERPLTTIMPARERAGSRLAAAIRIGGQQATRPDPALRALQADVGWTR